MQMDNSGHPYGVTVKAVVGGTEPQQVNTNGQDDYFIDDALSEFEQNEQDYMRDTECFNSGKRGDLKHKNLINKIEDDCSDEISEALSQQRIDMRQELRDGREIIEKPTRDQTTRDQTTRDQTTRDQTTRDQTTRDQTTRDQTTRDQTTRDQTTRDQTTRDQTTRDQTTRDQTTRDQTTRDQTTRDHSDDACSQDSNGDHVYYDDCYEPEPNDLQNEDGEIREIQDSALGSNQSSRGRSHLSSDSRYFTDGSFNDTGTTITDMERVCVDQLFDDNGFGQNSFIHNIKDSGYGEIHDVDKSECNLASRRLVSHADGKTPSVDEQFVDCFGDDADQTANSFVPADMAFSSDVGWDMLHAAGGDGLHVKVPVDCRPSVFVRFDPLYQQQVLDETPPPDLKTERDLGLKDRHESTDSTGDDLIQMSTPTKKQASTTTINKHPAARRLDQIAQGDNVDHLLAMSPSDDMRKSVTESSSVGPQDIVEVLKYSQLDMNRIKKEMELKWNACLLAKTKEWDKKQAAVVKENAELKKSEEDMKHLLQEYEKTMVHILAEKEKSAAMCQTAKQERDQAVEDLHSVEVTFSVLHRRFEKTRTTILAMKENEDMLKAKVSELQTKLKESDDYCNSIIKQAEDKLDQANAMIDSIKKSSAAEVAHLEAALKKRNIEYQTLEKNHEQKLAENKELMSICDELINKTGGS